MVRLVEGAHRDGRIELLGPAPTASETRVIVTFLTDAGGVDLAERGIGPEQAADLRSRLKPFDEDWQRTDMDAYDAL
ncbi:MAG: hypothetical protein IH855_10770 [Bacteroidetes bacterium]|nr:hypothetical protein [Bacteroidota bacterium]